VENASRTIVRVQRSDKLSLTAIHAICALSCSVASQAQRSATIVRSVHTKIPQDEPRIKYGRANCAPNQ
jgi:hypothetical protein